MPTDHTYQRPLIVTHHAPDLDAVGAVWLLKRFDSQHFADAKVAFVDPGATITLEEAEQHGSQLHEVTHVDTGLGKFDHHQPDRGLQFISASSLVFDHVCEVHPDLRNDQALTALVQFITETDHFREIFWPEADAPRQSLLLHELIHGMEALELHSDDSQLYFGMQCLDSAYANLKLQYGARQIIETEGRPFTIAGQKALGVLSSNDSVIKEAQKQGYMLVVRKDPEVGNIRIKCRPDAPFDLKSVADRLAQVDPTATWYYHPSGKMLLNGSSKQRNQKPSQLSLAEAMKLIQEVLS